MPSHQSSCKMPAPVDCVILLCLIESSTHAEDASTQMKVGLCPNVTFSDIEMWSIHFKWSHNCGFRAWSWSILLVWVRLHEISTMQKYSTILQNYIRSHPHLCERLIQLYLIESFRYNDSEQRDETTILSYLPIHCNVKVCHEIFQKWYRNACMTTTRFQKWIDMSHKGSKHYLTYVITSIQL